MRPLVPLDFSMGRKEAFFVSLLTEPKTWAESGQVGSQDSFGSLQAPGFSHGVPDQYAWSFSFIVPYFGSLWKSSFLPQRRREDHCLTQEGCMPKEGKPEKEPRKKGAFSTLSQSTQQKKRFPLVTPRR